LNRIGRVAEII
jgi:P-type E1-E2 ATPase